jgi:hypothetical protein
MTFLACISIALVHLTSAPVPPNAACCAATSAFAAKASLQPAGAPVGPLVVNAGNHEANQGRTGRRRDSTSPSIFTRRRSIEGGGGHRRTRFHKRLPNMPMPLNHGRTHKPFVRKRT